MVSWGISNPLADLAITKFSPLFLSLIECSVGFIFIAGVTLIRRIRFPYLAKRKGRELDLNFDL